MLAYKVRFQKRLRIADFAPESEVYNSYFKALLLQTDHETLYVSQNLVNCYTTVQQIEVMELQHYGQRTATTHGLS